MPFQHCRLRVLAAAVTCSVAAAVPEAPTAIDHPTLPTAWTAVVEEEGVGTVWESYLMVNRPTPENPSAKWTNFTDDPNDDGACRRLIYVTGTRQVRYYLKCHAVDCCYDDSHDGNHVEYQINNVHPAFLAPVRSLGKENITQSLFGRTIVTEVDRWAWEFLTERFVAYTSGNASSGAQATLHRWHVSAVGEPATNEYFNYTAVNPQDMAGFNASFAVPPQCRPSARPLKCDQIQKKPGMLSDAMLKVLHK